MDETIVILGNGFDRDLGIDLSFNAYCNYHLCPAYNPLNIDKKRWSDFENEIREKILSWYNNKKNEEYAKHINDEWKAFERYFSPFFTYTTNNNLKINISSCAYLFLKNFSNKSKVYTFNYTYPYEYVELNLQKEFTFVHGRYSFDPYDEYRKILIPSQSQNMIVGIDFKRMPETVKNNHYFIPIIKKLNDAYVETNIIKDLLKAKYVIIFGLSVGITDSDYFDEFFTSISNKTSNCQTIYYITKDEKGYEAFMKNIDILGYDKQIICSNVNIIPLYTEFGTDNDLFRKVLSLI